MMKNLLMALFAFGLLAQACQNPETSTQVELKQPTLTDSLSDLSVYNLPSHWTNQNGEEMELKDLKGNVVVAVMIYTSCKAACPRLVADMRHIEKTVKSKNKDKIKFLLVSIDPKVDTPERLKQFAIENEMDGEQWIFLRSNEEDTREFAATLAVNYKQISPIDFSHSNIISLFNAQGELVYQQEGLGVDYAPTIDAIEKEASKI
ncbi:MULTISPECIES: SCO family protein [Sphingobacterium]|uniref:SCO family protein n=1 Tax=Sphingobacterium TaxID=28453 RepID=UPI001BE44E98|nr:MULTISPECIES: SCO family protein [Sphingobacterium]